MEHEQSLWADDCSVEWSSLFLERYKKQRGETLKAVLFQ